MELLLPGHVSSGRENECECELKVFRRKASSPVDSDWLFHP